MACCHHALNNDTIKLYKNKLLNIMLQIIIHGRGGQGAKTFSTLLAEAAILSGKFAQAFPDYGPERTGAPVRAYLRVDGDEILAKEPIVNPDLVVVLDETLLTNQSVKKTLMGEPDILINTNKERNEIQDILKKEVGYEGKPYVIDANDYVDGGTVRVHFSAPIFGKLFKINEFIPLEDFKNVYVKKFEKKLGEEIIVATLKTIDRGYDSL
jgi:pyruvate ferredoxin oxidoreductase gamma subunit